MIFTDFSNFDKIIESFNLCITESEKKDKYEIQTKEGKTFRQATTFEETISTTGLNSYGAWFTSQEDAVFLTLEDISKLVVKQNGNISCVHHTH